MLRVFFLLTETRLISALSLTGTFYHLKFFFILQYINNSLALSFPLQYFINAQITIRLHRSLLHAPCFRSQPRLPWSVGAPPLCVLRAILEYLNISLSAARTVTSLLGSSSAFSWLEGVTGITVLRLVSWDLPDTTASWYWLSHYRMTESLTKHWRKKQNFIQCSDLLCWVIFLVSLFLLSSVLIDSKTF